MFLRKGFLQVLGVVWRACYHNPLLVFTDGACERDLHTIGGIPVRPGSPLRYFACHVPDCFVGHWSAVMNYLLGPVEPYAAVVARAVYASDQA